LGRGFRMRCYIARCMRKVVVIVGILASLTASSGVVWAQVAPSIGVEPSSCLSLDEPKSPSAATIAPIRDGGTIAGRVDRMRTLVMGASCRTLSVQVGGQVAFVTTPRPVPSTARANSSSHFSQARVVTSSMTRATTTTFETFGTGHVRLTTSPAAATAAPSLRDEGASVSLGASASSTSGHGGSASIRMLGTTLSPDVAAEGVVPATTGGGNMSSGVSASHPPLKSPQPFATRALLPSGGSTLEP
jgi:hypothetical protein